MNRSLEEFLLHTRPFANLPEGRLGEIARDCEIRHLPDGELLTLFLGEAQDRAFVVFKCVTAMLLEDERIDMLVEGDAFGHERLFIPETPGLGVEAVGDAFCCPCL
jgi:signal-transduction protein with cAMP-binding, CBS, and nucleotidyltransferase domain